METWLDKQVSLYSSQVDNIGRPTSLRDILLTRFADDLPVILALKKLNPDTEDYKEQSRQLKAQLQSYTPAALMATKAKGQAKVISRSGIMQLDFDYDQIKAYDIEELKRCVFTLPFIGFCGLSCSGRGFYALASIAEPEKLYEYAEHCFKILKGYGIIPDESKGKKPENLRYLSYDANMLIRENPEPLLITHFKPQQASKIQNIAICNRLHFKAENRAVNRQLRLLEAVERGNRMITIQKVAYTLGGLGDTFVLSEIKKHIARNTVFQDDLAGFLRCAEECFRAGMKTPFKNY